jgi:hypothetical protein
MDKFIVTKVFSIKPDKESEQSKKWTLELTIPAETTMQDLARAVLASEVVKVQNGNRDKFDKLPDGHVFKKTFNRPGIDIDPETAMLDKLANMDKNEQAMYIKELMKKAANR